MALADNLSSYWKLDGNSNDAVSTNNGTDTTITYSAANGILVQGAGLNGSSSFIQIGTNIANLKPTGNFSVQAWVKTSTTDVSPHNIYESYSQNTNVAGFSLGINVTGGGAHKVELYSGKNTGTTQTTDWEVVRSTTSVDTTAAWFHIVGTWDGTKLHIYVNGSEEGTGVSWANAPAYAATTYHVMGAQETTSTTPGGQWYAGAIDEVGVWTRALSASEITQLYNSGAGLAYPFPTGGLSPRRMTTNSKFFGS